MDIDLKRYEKLKSQVDQLQRDSDRAAGALSSMMKRLEEEFQCKTLEEAESLSSQLKQEVGQAEAKFNEALEQFEEEWGETLDE